MKAKHSPSLYQRFWSKVDIKSYSECWSWRAAVRNKKEGYGAFWFKGRHHPAPRIAYFLTVGEFPEKEMHTCHKCDNPSCCNPAHLFLGTHKENNDDKMRKGRDVKGSKNGWAKLTESDVVQIRVLREMGATYKEIGEKFNVHGAHVCDICLRQSWKHI